MGWTAEKCYSGKDRLISLSIHHNMIFCAYYMLILYADIKVSIGG